MKESNGGVERRDRRWLLRTYADCFTGSDAVAWLVRNQYAKTPEEAVGEFYCFYDQQYAHFFEFRVWSSNAITTVVRTRHTRSFAQK